MNVQVNVTHQKLRIVTNLKTIVSGSQEFVKFEFFLDKDWDGLTIFAQFRQEDTAYNKYLNEENCVYLPPEIKPGNCMLMLYGTKELVIATTNYVNLIIDENMLLENAESIELTEPLYNQLVEKVKRTAIPHIGDNGNWWFDDEDTGVSATEEIVAMRDEAVEAVKSAGEKELAAIKEVGADQLIADLNTAGEQQTSAVNNAGTTQVQNVNTAGAAQLSAIENKGANTLASIPDDYTTLGNDVSSLKGQKAPAIECEASGAIVTVDDAAAMSVHGLVSQIVPYQEGTGDPSPDNVRPISGWNTVYATRAHKNLLEKKPGLQPVNLKRGDKIYIKRVGGVSSFALYGYKGPVVGEGWLPIGSATLGGTSVTLKDDYNWIGISRSAFNELGDDGNIMVSLEPFNEIEPYEGQTISAELPETVYGGKPDWTNGVLTVDWKYIQFDGVTPGKMLNSMDPSNIGREYPGVFLSYQDAKDNCGICNMMPTVSNSVGGVPGVVFSGFVALRLHKDDVGITAEDTTTDAYLAKFNALLNKWYAAGTPLEVAFQTRTPIKTIQITPQKLNMLRGKNNFWSNCGDTSIVYVADTKMYIDKKFDALAAALIG